MAGEGSLVSQEMLLQNHRIYNFCKGCLLSEPPLSKIFTFPFCHNASINSYFYHILSKKLTTGCVMKALCVSIQNGLWLILYSKHCTERTISVFIENSSIQGIFIGSLKKLKKLWAWGHLSQTIPMQHLHCPFLCFADPHLLASWDCHSWLCIVTAVFLSLTCRADAICWRGEKKWILLMTNSKFFPLKSLYIL